MTRNRSSKVWLRAHAQDTFVKRARKEGYRSRAVYKLMQIDRRYRLLQSAMTVIDLGAAPGGWSQYARERVGAGGRVLAVDVLPLARLTGVEFVRGDITDPAVLDLLKERLAGTRVDLVISDIAPNISGDAVIDQARALTLSERVLELAAALLATNGKLLLKAFQGEEFAQLREAMQRRFGPVLTYKPAASRARSRELYLLGESFRRGRTQAMQARL